MQLTHSEKEALHKQLAHWAPVIETLRNGDSSGSSGSIGEADEAAEGKGAVRTAFGNTAILEYYARCLPQARSWFRPEDL